MKYYIEDFNGEIELNVDYDYYPPAEMTRHCPANDAEVEIYEAIMTDTGAEVCLMPSELDGIETMAMEQEADKAAELQEYKQYGYMLD